MLESTAVFTPHPFRAGRIARNGRPEAAYVIERMVDLRRRPSLKMDPGRAAA